jgi:hypothetical protein
MASTRPRTCGECAYLERTSPEQVFLKCRFWCGNLCHALGAEELHGSKYAVAHCHMQPWATACDWWLRKEIGESK